MIIRINHFIFLFAVCGWAFATQNSIQFNGDKYLPVHSESVDNVELVEYLRSGETLDVWEQMVSIRKHTKALRISDVMNPYAAARKNLYMKDVGVYFKSKESGNEDAIFEFLLKSPDGTFVEFVLVRASTKNDESVVLYVFSKKILMLDESNMENKIKKVLEMRRELFPALGGMSFEEIDAVD